MKSIRYSVNILIISLLSIHIHAVDNLRIANIRSIGMGGNGVTQSGLVNPALLTLNKRKTIHLDYFNRYSMKELGTVHVGFYYPNNLLSAGVDIFSFGCDGYRESMFRLSVGKRLNEKWRIGVSVQYACLQTQLFEEVPGQLSTDIGALFSPVDKLLIGLLIMNFPSVSFGYEDTKIQELTGYSIQIGFQWEIINNLLIAGTAESNKETTLTGNIGFEYTPFDNFYIRAGMQLSPLLPSLGVGYAFFGFTIDAATVYHPVLGVSTGLGMKYTF